MALHSSMAELGIGPGDVQELVCLRNTPPPDAPINNLNQHLGPPETSVDGPQPVQSAKLDMGGIGGP